MQMCPEKDYSTVVKMLALILMIIIDVKFRVGIEETKNQYKDKCCVLDWCASE